MSQAKRHGHKVATGMRKGELFGLHWQDTGFEEGFMFVCLELVSLVSLQTIRKRLRLGLWLCAPMSLY